jgi:hypothetical protein
MPSHPFDPVALVLGLTAILAGFLALTGGRLIDDLGVLGPAALIALGVALLAKLQPRRSGAGEEGAGDEVGAEGGEYR